MREQEEWNAAMVAANQRMQAAAAALSESPDNQAARDEMAIATAAFAAATVLVMVRDVHLNVTCAEVASKPEDAMEAAAYISLASEVARECVERAAEASKVAVSTGAMDAVAKASSEALEAAASIISAEARAKAAICSRFTGRQKYDC